jgi:release factor glutamine methyltransferase
VRAAAPVTTRDALRAAAGRLAAAGCDTPRLDAEVLLAHALGRDRAWLAREGERALDPAQAERFAGLARRREAREPVAYILGCKPFRHLVVEVDPRVLVPRPETELLVEVGLELAEGARVLDVGTGSGAVALALEHERPDLHVSGADAEEAALAVARGNAARLGLDVDFRRADLLAGAGGPFDAVLANLPYVAPEEWDDLEPEVHHEPRHALVAPDGGLAANRRLVRQAEATGVPLLAVEVGAGQAEAITAAMRAAGFARVDVKPDLAGIPRVVVGR